MSVGSILRDAREAKRLSQSKLAQEADVNQNSISKYEKAGEDGGQYPPLEKLARICIYLDIDPRILFAELVSEESDKRFFIGDIDGFYNNLEAKTDDLLSMLKESDKAFEMLENRLKALELKQGSASQPSNERNGPGIVSPSRSDIHTNNSEAVGAASTENPKGKSG